MPEITIQPVDFSSEEQRAAIVTLLESYADTPAGGSAGMTDEARQRVAADLAKHPTAVVLLAQSEQKPVGLAVGFGGYSTFTARKLLNLHDLVVAPAFRGRGIGTRLLEAVERHARGQGFGWLTLEVIGENTAAQRLYRRCGFIGGESITPATASLFLKKRLD